jgi:hypothetical protein
MFDEKLRRPIFATCIVGLSPVAAVTVQAKQCKTERPSNARSYWSYRLIDGRKCWYEGKPMLSKSLLHWRPARAARAATADDREREPILPASQYNFLDAQASVPDDSDSFEARWPRGSFEAVERK